MRFAVIEFHGLYGKTNGIPRCVQVYRDLALTSARDLVKAWGYQASYKGGRMDIVEDAHEVIEARIDDTLNPNLKRG